MSSLHIGLEPTAPRSVATGLSPGTYIYRTTILFKGRDGRKKDGVVCWRQEKVCTNGYAQTPSEAAPLGNVALMLKDEDYRTLAAVRAAIRGFAHFTEQVVQKAGLTPQQHQVLVALRASDTGELSIGSLAKALMLRHHSVSGLADRLEALGFVDRTRSKQDRRVVVLRLTDKARNLMSSLSLTHRDELRRIRPLLISLLSQLD